MASEKRTAADTLSLFQALHEKPYAFDFFQTLRRLECLFPDRPRIGQSLHVADDPVRLGQEPNLAFAPATLAALTAGANGRPPRLSVHFLGLFGANGPLPLHITEYVRDRDRNAGDTTLRCFADIFHHRILALFYRAWANSEPAVQHDRPADDRFAMYLGALFGLGMPSLHDRDAMHDLAKRYYAGRLVSQNRNAEGLRAMIADFLELPAEIEELVGEWVPVPEDYRLRLGGRLGQGALGTAATLGGHVWQCHHKFRIVIGPVGYADYQRLLPGRNSLARIHALVRNYAGYEYDWDVRVILRKEEIPPVQLGKAGHLGWTTWLGARARTHDARDMLLRPIREAA